MKKIPIESINLFLLTLLLLVAGYIWWGMWEDRRFQHFTFPPHLLDSHLRPIPEKDFINVNPAHPPLSR